MIANDNANATPDEPRSLYWKMYKNSLSFSLKRLALEYLKLDEEIEDVTQRNEIKKKLILAKVEEIASQTEEDFIDLISGGLVHE